MTIRKKHRQQLTHDEFIALNDVLMKVRVGDFNDIRLSDHTKLRMKQKHITTAWLKLAFYNGFLIEVKVVDDKEIRLILRYDEHRAKRSICVVYSLDGDIVTTWANRSKDKHTTMDWSKYDESLDILSVLGREMLV